jgi:hypothetical protein
MRWLTTPIIAAVAMTLASATPAAAWTRPGHMVAAAIAYQELMATDPDVAHEVLRLIEAHPDRGPFEVAIGRDTGEQRDRSRFVEIARWPDDIRGGSYDHPTWHLRLRPILDRQSPPPAGARMAAHGAALEAFAPNVAVARDPQAPAADRAIALCWIFHIIGDIHQPFHNAERYGADWPDGDAAGSKVFVDDPQTGEPIALHWLWDDAINRSPATTEAFAKAATLMTRYPRATFARQLAAGTSEDIALWSDESYALAGDLGYRSDAPRATTKEAAQPAAAAYLRDSVPAAERRLTLSAYRLTNLLRAMFDKPAPAR